MAFIEPNSHIKIYRGIETTYTRRPVFKTRAAQTQYFTQHLAFDYTPTTHVKYTHTKVRVSMSVAQLLGCNYLSFVNPSFGNKTYYAFIIGDPVYVNNDCTELTYAVDYFQTDMFDVDIERCHVDREHLTEEDYQKTVDNAFDPSVYEMWTSEPLVSDKDLEDYAIIEGTVSDAKWGDKVDKNDMFDLIAFTAIYPPSIEECEWFDEFMVHILNLNDNEQTPFAKSAFVQWTQTDKWWKNASGFIPTMNSFDLDPDARAYCNKRMCLNVIGEYHNDYVEFQTKFIRPYNILAISRTENSAFRERLDEFIDHLNSWPDGLNSIISIHSMPAYMVFEMFVPREMAREYCIVDCPTDDTLHNKKLLRYPYTYIRAFSPAGDIKEYQFERSEDVVGEMLIGQVPEFKFDLYTDYNATPVYSLIPINYKMRPPLINGDGDEGEDDTEGAVINVPNMFERLDFQQIPQAPYTTDAFVAALAASNAEILKSNTIENQNQLTYAEKTLALDKNSYQIMQSQNDVTSLKESIGLAQGARDTVAGMGPQITTTTSSANPGVVHKDVTQSRDYGQMALNVGGYMADSMQYMVNEAARANAEQRMSEQISLNQAQTGLRRNMLDDSTAMSLTTLAGNAVYENFRDTKPAYCCNKYFPTVGTGAYFYNDLMKLDFLIQVVKLRADVLKEYDYWLSNYGYASGRYKIPNIAQYIKNASSGLPHFAPTASGTPGPTDIVTYIKTTDARVLAPSKTSEVYWEAMLNGGVQFVRGESLITS